jgi:hypothetical protein
MRTHYGPWQPCWISNQHQKHKSGRGPSSEHFWQVWLISVQRFQRRRFKCEKLTDGRTTDAHPWQKLIWPMARWAKKWCNHLLMSVTFFLYSFARPRACIFLHHAWLRWNLQDLITTSGNKFVTVTCIRSSKSRWIVLIHKPRLNLLQLSSSNENIFL